MSTLILGYTIYSDENNLITVFLLLYQQRAVHFSIDAIYLDMDVKINNKYIDGMKSLESRHLIYVSDSELI
jgi:hypothetical protein